MGSQLDSLSLYIAVDGAGSGPALKVCAAFPCHLKQNIIWKRNVWFLQSRSWQVLVNFSQNICYNFAQLDKVMKKHIGYDKRVNNTVTLQQVKGRGEVTGYVQKDPIDGARLFCILMNTIVCVVI